MVARHIFCRNYNRILRIVAKKEKNAEIHLVISIARLHSSVKIRIGNRACDEDLKDSRETI